MYFSGADWASSGHAHALSLGHTFLKTWRGGTLQVHLQSIIRDVMSLVRSFALIHQEVQPVYLLGRRTTGSFEMTETCMDQSLQDFPSFVYPANMPRGTRYEPSMRLVSILCRIMAQIAAGPIAFNGPPFTSFVHLLLNIKMS